MAGIVHEVENHRLVEQAEQEAAEAARELAEIAHLRRGQIVVIGCSSFATAAYKAFRHPVALEEIRADAGLDIGGTLIGMHLKKVAVPVRLKQNRIGQAIVLAARTRPKFIGGERAIYDESLKDGYPDFTD